MRALSLFLSTPFVAAFVFVASSARADGALITIKDPNNNVLVNRETLNGLTVGTTQTTTVGRGQSGGATAGQTTYSPTTFEIDSPVGASALVKAAQSVTYLGVTIEFTTANAQGVEQVTSVGTFTSAMMTSCAFAFDDTGFRANYAFAYQAVAYGAPAAPASGPAAKTVVAPTVKLTQPMPTIQRLAVRKPIALDTTLPAPTTVDSLYLTVTGNTAAQSFPRTKMKSGSWSLDVPIVVSSGGQSRSPTFLPAQAKLGPATVTQAKGSPTLVFQQAVTSGTGFPSGTLSFVHTALNGTTSSLLDLGMHTVLVTSENVTMQAGVSTETTQFRCSTVASAP